MAAEKATRAKATTKVVEGQRAFKLLYCGEEGHTAKGCKKPKKQKDDAKPKTKGAEQRAEVAAIGGPVS